MSNKNITEVKEEFFSTVEKIKATKASLQEDYSVDKMEQIIALEKEKEEMFVELVKAGEPYYLKDNQIILTFNETEYPAVKERIEKYFTEEEKKVYFKEKITVSKDDEVLCEDQEHYKKYKETEETFIPQPQNQLQLQNPYQMAPYLLFPYLQLQGMYSQIFQTQSGYYDVNEEVVDLQRKLILAEQEKNWLKEDLTQIKVKYENLKGSVNEQKEQVKENEKMAEEIFALAEKLESMEEKNARLLNENTELNEICKKIKAENTSLLEDTSLSKLELDQVSTELNASKNTVKDIKEQLNDALAEIEKKKLEEKTADEIKEKYEDKVKKQETRINDLESSLKNVKASVEKEKVSLKKEIDTKKVEIENLRKKLEDKEQQLRENGKKNKDTQRELDELKNKVKETDGQTARMEELESTCSSVTSKNKELRTEIAKKEKEISDLKVAQEGTQKIRQTYEKQVKELEELAYKDKNTKVWNANAFNRDMKLINPSNVSIIRLGIADMKTINNNQGKKTGDHAISRVARVLEQVAVGTVYRVYGDNFTIVAQKGTAIVDCMNRVKQELSQNGIGIYYGTGVKSSTIRDLIREAEENMTWARGVTQANINAGIATTQETNFNLQGQPQQFSQQTVTAQPQMIPQPVLQQNIPQNFLQQPAGVENDEELLSQIM